MAVNYKPSLLQNVVRAPRSRCQMWRSSLQDFPAPMFLHVTAGGRHPSIAVALGGLTCALAQCLPRYANTSLRARARC
eukprot:1056907-Lingulodinium_polyedra.AAC.1